VHQVCVLNSPAYKLSCRRSGCFPVVARVWIATADLVAEMGFAKLHQCQLHVVGMRKVHNGFCVGEKDSRALFYCTYSRRGGVGMHAWQFLTIRDMQCNTTQKVTVATLKW
jgi:hypothetical protein